MSNLNNFWDDCIKDDYSEFNIFTKSKDYIHSSSNSNRTKLSTSNTTSHNTYRSINYYKSSNILVKTKNNNNINDYKTNITQKSLLSQYPSIKNEIEAQTYNKNNNKKKSKSKKRIFGSDYYSRNKSKNNNNSYLTSLEIKLRKNLSECTFHPKLVNNIKDKKLKEKLYNYSKFTMYERGRIFEMKKNEDNSRILVEEYKRRNKKYSFKPKINKLPSYKKVIFNDINNDILNNYYSRMNSAREYKKYKNQKMPFELYNYEETYENKNPSFFNKKNNNNINYIYGNKPKKLKQFNKLSPSLLFNKIISDKESELCKQNLHNILMSLPLNKNEFK